jgi:hypothetical protein
VSKQQEIYQFMSARQETDIEKKREMEVDETDGRLKERKRERERERDQKKQRQLAAIL